MPKDSKIDPLIQHIDESVNQLREIAQIEKGDFLKDNKNITSAKYCLQTAIESCINIANHIISTKRYRRPQDYQDAFVVLNENNILPDGFALTMKQMARLRNRLVHLYWEVSNEELYKYIQNELGDFDTYVRHILDFVEKQGESDEQE